MALTDKQLLAYLNVKGLGIKTAFKLAEYARENSIELYTPQEMYDFFRTLLCKKLISRPKLEDANAIIDGCIEAERVLEASDQLGIKFTTYYSDDFPSKLKDIRDAKGELDSPLILWYKGDLKIAEMPSVAIIGTREPTPEGIRAGNYLGREFAKAGFNIVSGLAYGCDKSGHEGALMADNGKTTAFLAHGLDTVYPPEHTELARKIVESGGLLISEYPVGTRGMANFFIARDRLQSGLSDACIVIQTGRTGGTLHAVRATVANKKPLYAVEYKDDHVMQLPKVQGNVMLLEEGVSAAEDSPVQKALPISHANCAGVIGYLKELPNKRVQDESKTHPTAPVQMSLF